MIEIYDTIIIGSGISGLFTLKHLLEENVKKVIVLDKNPEPFGVWNINNHPSVYEKTHTVSSKLYMTITDFPFPEGTPEFPHHSIILKYYQDYAKKFNLYPYIKQNINITSVVKKNNLWIVNSEGGTYYSKNIVCATGTVNDCPNIPTEKYYNNFTGQIIHSDNYEKIQNVKNKNILIVGGSDTSSDLAMELKNNNNVTISIKNGMWFQNRNFGAYEAADMLYNRIIDFFVKNIFSKKYVDNNTNPSNINNIQFWWGERGSGIDIWQSKCDYLNSYYVKSSEIIDQISKGVIIPENGIRDIQQQNITFETGNTRKYDIILFCTGYKPLSCINFLDKNIMNSEKYKHIFYPTDKSIMFVGYIRPYLTSIPMISEIQSRWIAKVISDKCLLPSVEEMEKEIAKDDLNQSKEFPCSYDRLKTIIDPYSYYNTIAKKIDAIPNYINLFFTNIFLFYKIMVGSWNQHVYRLNDESKTKQDIAIDNINKIYNSKGSKKIEYMVIVLFYYYLFYFVAFIIILFLLYHSYRDKKQILKYIKKKLSIYKK